MERKDLIAKNCTIFSEQGAAIEQCVDMGLIPDQTFLEINQSGAGVGCAPPPPARNVDRLLPSDNRFYVVRRYASKDIKILVVANPANTNCLILKSAAPSIPAENFSALTYLDHNRARAQIAIRLNTAVANVTKTCIWGNHSSTQVPDANNGVVTIDGVSRAIPEAIGDDAWLGGEFVKTVQTRGAAVIKARKLSSAMSVRDCAVTVL